MKEILVENVIVDNGIEQHKVQYVYSPNNILSCVTRALFNVREEVKNEINDKELTIYIKTDSDYIEIISKSVINADNDLLFRFFGRE